MFVYDATPLIYLAKTENVDPVISQAGDCCIPERVYEEVVETGIREGHADARRIQLAVDDGILDRKSVSEGDTFSRLCENSNLSEADAAVLTIAKDHDGIAIIDERYGRAIADAEGILTRGTAYLVLIALREEHLTREEARTTIDEMIEMGWFVSPPVYSKIVERIDEIA